MPVQSGPPSKQTDKNCQYDRYQAGDGVRLGKVALVVEEFVDHDEYHAQNYADKADKLQNPVQLDQIFAAPAPGQRAVRQEDQKPLRHEHHVLQNAQRELKLGLSYYTYGGRIINTYNISLMIFHEFFISLYVKTKEY